MNYFADEMCLLVEYAVKHTSLELKIPHDFRVLCLTNVGLLFAVPPLIRRFSLHPPNILEWDKA